MIDNVDRRHLERCVRFAAYAFEAGNEPFGSLLVSEDGTALLEAVNEVGGGDSTQHPEFAIASRSFPQLLKSCSRSSEIHAHDAARSMLMIV